MSDTPFVPTHIAAHFHDGRHHDPQVPCRVIGESLVLRRFFVIEYSDGTRALRHEHALRPITIPSNEPDITIEPAS